MNCNNTYNERCSLYCEDSGRQPGGCGENGWDYNRFPVGMTYTPMQPWENLYDLV